MKNFRWFSQISQNHLKFNTKNKLTIKINKFQNHQFKNNIKQTKTQFAEVSAFFTGKSNSKIEMSVRNQNVK